MKELTILGVYRHKGKTVAYNVVVNDNNDFDCYVLSKAEVVSAINGGAKIINGYIRGNSIVVKDTSEVGYYKYRGSINVCRLETALGVDTTALFNDVVEPSMLDANALGIIKQIDNVEPEKNVTEYGKFSGNYGVCSLYDLSEGCKTALYIYFCERDKRKCIVNVTSMGLNGHLCIFDVLSRLGNKYVALGYTEVPFGLTSEFDGYIFKDIRSKPRQFMDFMAYHI